MLTLRTILRRASGRIGFDERTGEVCTAACRAAARRAGDLERTLIRRGPR